LPSGRRKAVDKGKRLGLSGLGDMIRKREISPVELVRASLTRIRSLDGRVNAFMRVLEAEALSQAEEAEREIAAGGWRGPLHGVPVAVKDLFDVAGVPTTAGSKIWRDFIPQRDAAVVERLKTAGAVLVGKLSLHEFAFGITSRNPHYGPTLNPWELAAMCGGSSSGSAAALAAGFVPLTLGTDTGGSIRIPCSLCGTVGLKPTYGLVSRRGVLPLAWSLDHVGPMALHVEDIALALGVIAGHDPEDPTSARRAPVDYQARLAGGVEGLVVGVPKTFFYEGLREDVRRTVLGAVAGLESLGARVEEIDLPGVIEADRAAYTVLFSEAAANLELHARTRPEDVGEEVMHNVRLGMTIPATRYIQALRVRTRLLYDLRAVFSRVKVMVVPATAVDAQPIESTTAALAPDRTVDIRTAMTRFTRYFNLAGNPVLSLPCGFSDRRLPVGMQLVGPPFGEATLLRVGHAYQKAFPLDPLVPVLE
jgi:aspartyl-tRNA(Asn)/glutamyl-tRNA(Gln) amidotransferase subunit A